VGCACFETMNYGLCLILQLWIMDYAYFRIMDNELWTKTYFVTMDWTVSYYFAIMDFGTTIYTCYVVGDECGIYLYVCICLSCLVCGLHKKQKKFCRNFLANSTGRECSISQ
jgi:hypothetical protein